MLSKVKNVFVFSYFVVTLSVLSVCNSQVIKNEWVKPDAFSRKYPPSQKQIITSSSEKILDNGDSCPVCPQIPEDLQVAAVECTRPEEDIATVLYKRLVTSLFLKDNDDLKSMTKILKFSLTENHLKILESSSNIRDWDGVMSEVIASLERIDPETNFIYKEHSHFSLNLWSLPEFLFKSEVKFILIVILFICLAVILKEKYRWGVISIIAVTLISSGYFYTYLECNRQLELDELVHNINFQENPCEHAEKPKGFFGSIFGIFSNPKKDCEKYLRKKHQIKSSFCRPDEVFTKYLNNLMFDQLEILVKKSIDIFQRCSREIPFPYNIVAMISLPFLVIAVIKLVFQYIISPGAWFPYFKHYQETQAQPVSGVQPIQSGISHEHFLAVMDTIRSVTNNNNKALIAPHIAVSQNTMIEDVARKETVALNEDKVVENASREGETITEDKMSGVELLDDPNPIGEDSGTASNESGISNESCDRLKPSAS